jgi:hypothetical protein
MQVTPEIILAEVQQTKYFRTVLPQAIAENTATTI